MNDSSICTVNLFKSYDSKYNAVDDISMDIPAGTIFGLLGPNGAGKTTIVKLLSGLLRPTKGSCYICGISPQNEPEKAHRICGIVTETAKMYGHMTGMQNLAFFGQMFGMDAELSHDTAESLLKQFDLWDARDKKLNQYSTGMAKRLSLARAIVHRPQVLILDEPYAGLDSDSQYTVDELLSSLARTNGVTILICTHQLEYASSICGNFGIIDKGRLLASGDMEQLRVGANMKIGAAVRLGDADTVENFKRCGGGWWRTEIADEKDMPAIIADISANGHDIYEAKLEKPTIRDIYNKYVQRKGGQI